MTDDETRAAAIEAARTFCGAELDIAPNAECLMENYDWCVVLADFALRYHAEREAAQLAKVIAELKDVLRLPLKSRRVMGKDFPPITSPSDTIIYGLRAYIEKLEAESKGGEDG